MRRTFLTMAALSLATLSACTSDPGASVDRADTTVAETAPSTTTTPATTERDEVDDTAEGERIDAEPPVIADGTPVDDVNPDDRPPATTGAAPESTAPPASIAPPSPDAIARVISLEATHTETMFAIGAGDLLVGVNPDSDHPAEATELRRAGLERGTADLSAIEELDPDLVLVGDDPTGMVARLTEAGIAVWQGGRAQTVDDAFTQIGELGTVVGRPDDASALVDAMRSELAELRAGLPADGTLTYFHEIDPGLTTAAPGGFIDAVYAELGLVSIAPADGSDDFTQLTFDAVVGGDPDVIVLADATCCAVDAAVVAGRSGWDAIGAVQTGAIAELPDRVSERWGPRLIDWWRLIAGAALVAAG